MTGDAHYAGSCHCGAVAFTVAGDVPASAMSCNCSHCRRKGFLLTFVPASAFALTAGDDATSAYLFNRHAIRHLFCATCGCQTHGEGSMPDGSATIAVNLRCVPTIDPDTLGIERVDGASF